VKWATRKHIYTDRVASAWLIRRFIDPDAEFHFFEADRLLEEAGKIGARTFDAPGADFGHVEFHCSFETLMHANGLWGKDPALDHMAEIVNAADVRIDLWDFRIPEGLGLYALGEGFGECLSDDHERLEKMTPVYEALYQWCRKKMEGMKLTRYEPPRPAVYDRVMPQEKSHG